ncbi:hypothetical protein E5D57_010699 [Metarhizium anisopliae]|nr:hypothetical protein E5D57_010699 [Metarhizium anisopliae]
MPSLSRLDRSTFTPFNPSPLLDPNNFMLAITVIIDYINFGNTRQEVVQLRDLAQAWCERYFSTPQFARHKLDRVLKHHPNLFNFSIISRARLDSLPAAAAANTDNDNDNTAMDVYGFPTYVEPSLFEDHVLYEMLDIVAARQQHLQQIPNGDPYAHLRPQVSAASLKDSHIVWNLPEVMASLARLNIAALDDGTGTPMFVDPPAPTAADSSMNAGAAPAQRASASGSDMSPGCGSGCDCMSLDGTPDEDAEAEVLDGTPEEDAEVLDRTSDEDAELSDASFLTAESDGTFQTARTSPEAAGPGALARDGDDSQMGPTDSEEAAAEQDAPGEAMEGVEEQRHPVLRGYFAMIRRKMEEARLRLLNADAEDMS